MSFIKGLVRDLWSRRASLVVLTTLEAVGVAALFVGGTLIQAMLRPVPFPRADAVVQIWNQQPARGLTNFFLTRRETEFYREHASSLESLLAFTTSDVVVTDTQGTRSRRAVKMAGDICELLGVAPVVGRCLAYSDTAGGASPVVVIRAGEAVARYRSAAQALGADVLIDSRPYRVIGVVPDRLQLRLFGIYAAPPADYMMPLPPAASTEAAAQQLMLMGRLGPQASLATAISEMDTLSRSYAAQLPDLNSGKVAQLLTLAEETVKYAKPQAMAISIGAMLLALLVVFNSLVVRAAEARRHRPLLLLKTALGASARRLLAEEAASSVSMLAAVGVLAWTLAMWVMALFVQTEPWGLTALRNDAPSFSAFMIALMLVGGASASGGLAVMWHFLRMADFRLTPESRTVGGTRAEARATRSVLMGQCAMTAVLLGCTLVLMKTMWNLANVDLGVQTNELMTVQGIFPPSFADTPGRRQIALAQLLHQDMLPADVEAITVVNHAPLSRRATIRPVELADGRGSAGDTVTANYRVVAANYFDVAGLRILAGRTFAGPQPAGAAEYLVNRAFVERYLSGRDPIGTLVRIPQEGGTWDDGVASEGVIVGVVEDVRHWGPDRAVPREIYLSYEIDPPARFAVLFRPRGDLARAGAAMQGRLRSIAPELAAFPVEPIHALVRVALAPHWFATGLFGLFAVAAIVVTALGLYGLASGYVTSRRAEIAVRLSIGASQQEVVRLVARQALVPAVLGSIAGAMMLTGTGRLLQTWLYEVRPTDPSLLVSVPLAIFTITLVAVLGPLWAALRVEAIELLRDR